MQTLDLTALYHLDDGPDLLRGIEMSLSVQNVFDQAPPYLKNARAYYVNYDSTNYSAIGRFVGFSVTKNF